MTTDFTYAAGTDDGPGWFAFSGRGTDAFLACPSNGTDGIIVYSVFANVTAAIVPAGNVSACVGIGAAAYAYTYEDNVVAYQYE